MQLNNASNPHSAPQKRGWGFLRGRSGGRDPVVGAGADAQRATPSAARFGSAWGWALGAWTLGLSVATLWPFWIGLAGPTGADGSQRAYQLRDMMVAPHPALNAIALGTADGPPRAIPQDTLLALASAVVPATVLAAGLMVLASLAGAWGAAALARWACERSSRTSNPDVPSPLPRPAVAAAQACAIALTLWNPYVAERLLQGQWTVAAAAMLLPAVAYCAVRVHTGAKVLALALTALTPSGVILGAAVALTLDRGWRARLGTLLAAVGLAAPWLLATAVNGGGAGAGTASAASARAFAAGPEPGVGTLGALAGLGGLWNTAALPASRGLAACAASLVVAVVLLAGVVALGRRWPGVVALTVAAIVLPALAATGPGVALMGWAVETLPGAGLLRDAQKFVALALPGYVVGIGVLLARVAAVAQARSPKARAADRGGAVAALAGIALTALVLGGVPRFPADIAELAPQPLPPAWSQVGDAVSRAASVPVDASVTLPSVTGSNAAGSSVSAPNGTDATLPNATLPNATAPALTPQPGPRPQLQVRGTGSDPVILSLPPGNYRTVRGLPVVAPELKLLPGVPVDPGFLIVDGRVVDGNAPAMRALRELVGGKDTLAARGVDWVLVDANSTAGNTDAGAVLSRHQLVLSEGGFELYRVLGTGSEEQRQAHASWNPGRAWPVHAGMGCYALVVATGLALLVLGRRWRRR